MAPPLAVTLALSKAECQSSQGEYTRAIEGLKAANILLDRKVLSDIAIQDEGTFTQIVTKAKAALDAKTQARVALAA